MKNFIIIMLVSFSIVSAAEGEGDRTPIAISYHSIFNFADQKENGNFTTGPTTEQKAALKEYYKASHGTKASTFVPSLITASEDLHARDINRVEGAMKKIIAEVKPIKDVADTTAFKKYQHALLSIQNRISIDKASRNQYNGAALTLRDKELALYEEYKNRLESAISAYSKQLELTEVD